MPCTSMLNMFRLYAGDKLTSIVLIEADIQTTSAGFPQPDMLAELHKNLPTSRLEENIRDVFLKSLQNEQVKDTRKKFLFDSGAE